MSDKLYVTGEQSQFPRGIVILGQGPSGSSYALLPLVVDSSGNLKVSVTGAGSGGTSAVDQSTFIAGTTAGTPAMAENSGEVFILSCDAARNLNVNLAAGGLNVPTSNTSSAPSQTTLGTVAAQALASNAARKGLIIQNQGTTVIKVLLGAGTPTQASYTVALPACGTANDGSSPAWFGPPGTTWTGAVQWISSAGGGLCEAVELT